MPRTDLIALTDDGLIQLANAGLVKRGLRELEAGIVPEIVENGAGLITASFADGTVTRLPAGKGLVDASCTCPSSGLCRHRIMLALTYRARNAQGIVDDGQGPAVSVGADWDPKNLDLEAFEEGLGPAARSDLKRLTANRLDIELDRGRTPSARLPMATVRFLVPNEISYARCDCVQGTGCAHVALALRAFRFADGARRVTLGAAEETARGGTDIDALRASAEIVVARLLEVGVVAGPEAHAQTIATARHLAGVAGAVQMQLSLGALGEQIEAYAARSARYDELDVLQLATELLARTRAKDRAAALGLSEPFETPMTKSRYVSLGVKLRQEDEDIRASLLMADSDTSAVVMLERVLTRAPSSSDQGPANILGRQLMPGLSLSVVGRGQLLTSVAKRRADGLLTLGAGHGGKTQAMPRDALFGFLPPLAALAVEPVMRDIAERPVALVRPRRRIHDVHVFDIGKVLGQAWSPGSQIWQAAVTLKDGGGTLYLERRFDAAAPFALDVMTATLEGRFGPLRQLSGPARVANGALICEPWSLGADRFVVPDIESSDRARPSLLAADDTDADLIEQTARLLATQIHAGRRARGSVENAIAQKHGAELRNQGFQNLAGRFDTWRAAPVADIEAFASAAIWALTLTSSR
ncbi:SWIM zinc finger family protein [Labrys neptuniae]|uniref:SWIM zinc finger family protein n=1 Tax=Labrys neptuniae TaxID=376174 RepID=UPI00288E461F|nr:SWIM zinc finger family protein [Labrys neptuniae]MDT3380042.1 SWIM zinc finger family protein [Labrys neptuniae]